ncbi:MAG: serine/threonine protein kinase [Actinobacteria bacterium]|nr:serine/threonine protein kinase [Actinomycetota bacterium]
MNNDLPQNMLLGRYQISGAIGQGGFGKIYRAYDSRMGREVAIKVIEDTHNPEYLIRESKIIARISHPNIVTIYDLQEDRNNVYMIMELIEGTSLQEIYDSGATLSVSEAISIAYQVCSALEAAHRRGIAHLDIKPSNILISRDGKIKVADFGIARILGESYEEDEGYILGTEEYMAPEVLEGEAMDSLSDIFAAGIVIYEMLTGNIPQYPPEDSRYRNPSDTNKSVPKKLDELLNSCIAIHRSQRLDDISYLKDELEELIDRSPSSIELELKNLVHSTVQISKRPVRTIKFEPVSIVKNLSKQLFRFYQPILRILYSLIAITPVIISWIFFRQVPVQIFSAAVIVTFFMTYFFPKFGIIVGSAGPLYFLYSFNIQIGIMYSILWVFAAALLFLDLNAGALTILFPLLWMSGLSFLPTVLAAYLFEPALSLTVAITGTLISEISMIFFSSGALPNLMINWPNISSGQQDTAVLLLLKSALDFVRENPLQAIQLVIFALLPGLFSFLFKTNKKLLQLFSLFGCMAFIGFTYFWFFDKFLKYQISTSSVIKNIIMSTVIMVAIILIGGKETKSEPTKKN